MACDKPYTSTDKWTAAVISGLSFLAVSSPYTYSLTNAAVEGVATTLSNRRTAKGVALVYENGSPTPLGLVIHSFVYMYITRLMMEKRNLAGCKNPYTSSDKWRASVIGGLLFGVISSPIAYSALHSLTTKIGIDTLDDEGAPNIQGLLIHSTIFTACTRLLMR
jgi:hypothetical protein